MNYASWSELIYKYYFGNNSGTRVMFHITLQDLVDFAKEENVEIANRRYASEFNDDFIRRDFVSKFWSIPKDGNNDIKDFEKKILNLKKTAIEKRNYKELLTIVAVLIMPICENDELELHGNDYYGHLLPFLYVNKFIKSKENKTRDLLNTIRLDEIWNVINKWAASESLAFKSSQVVSENGTRHYARSLMKESLLSPSRLQKFCIIFERAGLAPRVNIENDRLLSAFNNYHQYIGLSQIKYKQLTSKDFKGYLESILRQEYDNWDGSTKIKERDRKTGQSREESGNTYYPLLLLMKYDIHTKSIRFGFHLYCADIDDMEDMNFIIDDSKEILPSIYIKSDGYANKPFYLEETVINNILQNKNKVFGIHEINSETIKGRFIVTDYYLLKAHKNGYIATNEFIKGEFYFIILNNNTVESFTEWLEENSAELISEVIFGGLYSLYKIDCAVKEMPQRNNLRFKSEIRCKSTNNIEVKTADQSEIILLSKLFPAQFEITGVDVINDKIYAVSVNCEHRNSTELTYDHERSLWILNVFSNVFQLNKEFQLYCNEAPIPYGHTYKFSDFILPTSFKEVQLNEWGETKGEVFSSGLTLPDHIIKKNLIRWQELMLQMKKAPILKIENKTYKNTDYLLYALTSASYQTDKWMITKDWIKTIINRIINEKEDDEAKLQKNNYVLQNILADYFRMGYINYAHTDKGLCLTANHPTLILMTPNFTRDIRPGMFEKKMVTVNCAEKWYKCLLSGGRTISLIKIIEKYQSRFGYKIEVIQEDNILMPQTIFIHAENRSTFVELAKALNLKYQDNIYANALLEQLPSVNDYIQHIVAYGTRRDLFYVKHFRTINYQKMAEIYPDRLSCGKAISNAEIDKKDFDRKNDFVTFFPGKREEVHILIHEGEMTEVDKYWGHFIGMKISNAKILVHDGDKAQISMPQQLRLPLLYARALTLLTGQTPTSTFGSRTYNIGVNPYTQVSASGPNTILKKLEQI